MNEKGAHRARYPPEKKNKMKILLFASTIFMICQTVPATYTISLTLDKFENPQHILLDGTRCDDFLEGTRCDHRFYICLVYLVGSEHDDFRQCRIEGPFKQSLKSTKRIETELHQKEILMKVVVYDFDHWSDDDLVDLLYGSYTIGSVGNTEPSEANSLTSTISGTHTELTVTLAVYCLDGWMGPDCDCFNRHPQYTCDDNGTKICPTNWYGRDCDIFKAEELVTPENEVLESSHGPEGEERVALTVEDEVVGYPNEPGVDGLVTHAPEEELSESSEGPTAEELVSVFNEVLESSNGLGGETNGWEVWVAIFGSLLFASVCFGFLVCFCRRRKILLRKPNAQLATGQLSTWKPRANQPSIPLPQIPERESQLYYEVGYDVLRHGPADISRNVSEEPSPYAFGDGSVEDMLGKQPTHMATSPGDTHISAKDGSGEQHAYLAVTPGETRPAYLTPPAGVNV